QKSHEKRDFARVTHKKADTITYLLFCASHYSYRMCPHENEVKEDNIFIADIVRNFTLCVKLTREN
ncbi:MAG: hypothetical protein SO386_03990, partial [Eubacteriales bacterium]|nr:hypothetical protein [Eubacteriales bacterium]